MERSAIYRRALAPVMIFVGVIGIVAGAEGSRFVEDTPLVFVGYWMLVCIVVMVGAFILVRRQALKSAEPFWSPPTRRIARAMLPPLFVGFVFGLIFAISLRGEPGGEEAEFLAAIWMVLYGLALNAAGFFMPGGIKLFGWIYNISGLALVGMESSGTGFAKWGVSPHVLMGVVFGVPHLAYGIYLYFTEPRKNEA